MRSLTFQVASDVRKDSLILEVLNIDGDCVASVERFDTDKKLKFQIFIEPLDFACVQEIFEIAEQELHAFEDGTPLSEAKRDDRFAFQANGS